eukprot:gene2444-2814_t
MEQGLHLGERTKRQRLRQAPLGVEQWEEQGEIQELERKWKEGRDMLIECCWKESSKAYLGTEDEGRHNDTYNNEQLIALMKRRKKHMG